MNNSVKKVAIIVAHPDDETLWAGGTILSNPLWLCFIVCLCRKNDPDRSPKFEKALKALGANGIMGDLDDGPEQKPLPQREVEDAVLKLIPPWNFDLIITHSINGEYTRHLRHEEVGKAVINLWKVRKLATAELWAFAYEDNPKTYFPTTINDAPICYALPPNLWDMKHTIITAVYGFKTESWEAQTTPKKEAFWQFFNADHAFKWLVNGSYSV